MSSLVVIGLVVLGKKLKQKYKNVRGLLKDKKLDRQTYK